VSQFLSTLAAIAGGLSFGGVIAVAVVRYAMKDWVVWRVRVEAKIDRLQPEHILKLEELDPERIREHYEKVHTLSNKVMETSMTVERHEVTIGDHEARIRGLEKRGTS
jgi:esterase/lipase